MGQNEQRALVVAVLALAFSTLMLASAPRWAACVSAALAVLAVVPLTGSRRILRWPQPLLLLLSILFVATLFQLLPLPAGLVHVLAPARYDLAAANAHAYGEAMAGFMPLSQDWPATLVELAKFAGYLSFAYVCTRLCASRQARQHLLVAVCAVGVIVALCALGHRALGAKDLLGIYTPSVTYKWSVSPFINPNHLAGYLAMVVPVCLGLAVHRRSWLFLSMAALCALTSIQAVSRGGIVALCVGLTVTLLLATRSSSSWRDRGGKLSPRWAGLGVLLLLAGIALVGTSAGRELLSLDFAHERDVGKFLAWRSVPEAIASSPWVGLGRGAFESGFTQFQPATGVIFSHIENEYLQTVLDWGVPMALSIAFVFVLLGRAVFRRGVVDGMAAGSMGGIAAVSIQSFVDFGLQLPGLALPAIAILASLLPGRLVVEEDKNRRRALQIVRLAAVAAFVILCALAASSLGARPAEDLAGKSEFEAGYSGEAAQVVASAARLARRHPASYLIPAKATAALRRLRDPRAFNVLARALDLHPNHYGVHLLAAQLLASSQEPRQALAEYRAALALPGGLKRQILESVLEHFSSTDDLLLAMPRDPNSAASFGGLLLQLKRPQAAQALATRTLDDGAASYDLYQLAVRSALRSGDVTTAVRLGSAAADSLNTDESLLLHVQALRAAELPLLARQELHKRVESIKISNLEVLEALLEVEIETKDFVAARQTATTLLELSGSDMKQRKAGHLLFAIIEEHEGNRHQAAWHRQQAADLRQH